MLERVYRIFCKILEKYDFKADFIDEIKNEEDDDMFIIAIMRCFVFFDMYMLFINNEDDYEDFDDRIDICEMFMNNWFDELEEKLF